MANPPATTAPGTGLIGGLYRVAFNEVLPNVAPPLTAYAAYGERATDTGLMAVSVARGWPARARVLTALTGAAVPNLITPVAHGAAQLPSGEGGYFIICPAPQGASLQATLRAWNETELLQNLLRPAAAILADLQQRNLTHRSLRPENLFQLAQRGPVSLGQAWAAPPACHQPDWLEPPYSASCLPCGRGNGSIADDVYALGAVMVMFALGAHPLPGVEPAEILRRKLELGSFAALAEHHRLPSMILDLARGMLADDPEHRPSPVMLTDPQAARARRIAARPPRRSPRPLELGGYSASTARTLAYALNREPEQTVSMLRSGVIDRWLRRGLGDSQTAGTIDDAVTLRASELALGDGRADAQLIARTVAILDPSAPLTWRSVSLWPDGLGPALDHALHHDQAKVDAICEIAFRQIFRMWGECRPMVDGALARLDAKDIAAWAQASQGDSGALRLNYLLNPLAPCESPSVARRWVTRLLELLPALELGVGEAGRSDRTLVDAHLAAFIIARRDERLDVDISQLSSVLSPTDLMSQLRLLARLQHKLHRGNLPGLSKWAVAAAKPLLDVFSSRSRRERIAASLEEMAAAGQLPAIVALVDNPAELAADERGLLATQARVAAIDASLNALATSRLVRPRWVKRVAQDVTGALGLLACVVAMAVALFA